MCWVGSIDDLFFEEKKKQHTKQQQQQRNLQWVFFQLINTCIDRVCTVHSRMAQCVLLFFYSILFYLIEVFSFIKCCHNWTASKSFFVCLKCRRPPHSNHRTCTNLVAVHFILINVCHRKWINHSAMHEIQNAAHLIGMSAYWLARFSFSAPCIHTHTSAIETTAHFHLINSNQSVGKHF